MSILLLVALFAPLSQAADHPAEVAKHLLAVAESNPRIQLDLAEFGPSKSVYVRGTFRVPENRARPTDRRIELSFLVLPARSERPAPDPVFILHGGPGAPATMLINSEVDGWLREDHDVVLIDQRGTGNSNLLTIQQPGSDANPQGYFESFFQPALYQRALPALTARADLTQYTTSNAVDDFDELRAALGYKKINLRGGSYGTRAALVFMRRHPDSIRTATLSGIAPIAFRNPLDRARMAQNALDKLFDEIEANPKYAAAFGDVRAHFQETLDRLAKEPANVTLPHPQTGKPIELIYDRDAFAEGVRLQLYTLRGNRRLPLLLERAHAGDFTDIAAASLAMARGMQGLLAWGMLMCVTGNEDLWRIDPDEIEAACAGTFLGDRRVRQQLAVGAIWPSGQAATSFAKPVHVHVPTLLLSGSVDPVTGPEWGALAHKNLPNSLYVIAPGAHGVSGPEIEALKRQFLNSGTVKGLDPSAIEALVLPPLELPKER